MAGVRREDIEPIAVPRGLPADATVVTKFDYECWDGDAHTPSWLSAQEIYELSEWMRQQNWDRSDEADMFGYLFGNYFSDFIRYPEQREKGLEDVRFVFWFDN